MEASAAARRGAVSRIVMAALKCDSKAALGNLFSIDWRWSYASALIAFGRRQRLTAMVGLHQFRITEVHRIPERVPIPVGPHAGLGRVLPVAQGEQLRGHGTEVYYFCA